MYDANLTRIVANFHMNHWVMANTEHAIVLPTSPYTQLVDNDILDLMHL